MFLLSCILLLALGLPVSTSDSGDPVDIKKLEEVEVDLVLIDALVLDRKGRTVPGLTRDDFEVVVDMVIRPIDTLDELCDAGAADDPRGMRNPAKRAPIEAPKAGRKIVLAFDYMHLNNVEQIEALKSAMNMIENGTVAGEEIMVAALNGRLRIEQPFTTDADAVSGALRRMQNDISLWGQSYDHITEIQFFHGLQTLVDFLGIIDGSKAIVLYSNNRSSARQDDLPFMELTSSAASSRCSMYPVHVAGLETEPAPGAG
jgi:VWFA-related protein